MSSKSLLCNANMHLFTYKEPKKSNILSYEVLAIDKNDGPYQCKSTNEYQIDACYYSHEPIYSVGISNILEETKMVPIHDCILYNKHKWSSSFKNWFESKSIRIAPRGSLNSVIYQSNKFILVTWLAPKSTLFAYPGYEKLVSVCGGPVIDANKIINKKFEWVFRSDTVWYIDSGESFDVVAAATESIQDKVYSIMEHTKSIRSIAVLQTALRKAPTKLKIAKFGERFFYSTFVPPFIWNEYLLNACHRFNVKTKKTGKIIRWKMSYGIADCIFKTSFFSKVYYNQFDNGEILVFASNIKTSINLASGRMIFKGFILKETDERIFGVTSLPEGSREEFWITLLDISSNLRLMILDFLSISDLLICKNVSAELALECLQKLNAN
eukprot:447475_1